MRGGIAGLFYLGGLHADFITNQLRGVCIACSISLSLLLPLYPPCSKFISKNLKSNQIFVLFPLKAASHPGPRTQLHPESSSFVPLHPTFSTTRQLQDPMDLGLSCEASLGVSGQGKIKEQAHLGMEPERLSPPPEATIS